MLYRTIPAVGKELSILGFGCMRLPVTAGGGIDEPAAERLMRAAFDGGINYFDTAWPYHEGKCEEFVGRAIKGYRDRITLATKLPVWLVHEPRDMDDFLEKQLGFLRTDHVDLYLLHSLSAARWRKLTEMGALEFMERAKASGKIRHIAFSFHDGLDTFRTIVDAYPWDMCQIQYNLLDRNFQAGAAGLEYAAAKGIGVVVMEPLKGGNISLPVPEPLRDEAREAGYSSPNLADLGLRWVWDHPGVSVVLSGMTTPEQLSQNLASADRGRPGGLSDAQRRFADRVWKFFSDRMRVPCTACAYCKPCPQGVDIPQCFTNLNTAAISGNWELQGRNYRYVLAPDRDGKRASACVSCGACVPKCPQGIPIPEKLREVAEAFELGE
ncbi:aldo/keto reductase [uncultured Fretibacterium sp.]|uniref:aldo/keto reductase n=1 Tax=uncultured Fretibacterium sp. TaxID=1678694 RepID=UPI00325FD25C